jgi:hypothetical protein
MKKGNIYLFIRFFEIYFPLILGLFDATAPSVAKCLWQLSFVFE